MSSCTFSIEQAIAIAQANIGGTVFDVRVKDIDHQAVWRVKLLRKGERLKVYVDAGSGNIIEVKAEHVQKITSRTHEPCGASLLD
jgi:uncharacterized membrane protein YkoI